MAQRDTDRQVAGRLRGVMLARATPSPMFARRVYESARTRHRVAFAAGVAVVASATGLRAQGAGAAAPPTVPAPPPAGGVRRAQLDDARRFDLDSVIRAVDTVTFVADTTLALPDAVRLAIRMSPVTAAAVAEVRIARSDEQAATGEFLPTLEVNSSAFHH